MKFIIKSFQLFNNNGGYKAYNPKKLIYKENHGSILVLQEIRRFTCYAKYLDELDAKVNNILVKPNITWNQQLIEKIELQNMVLSAKVTLASLTRDFSLGGHVRLDGKENLFF